MALRTWCAGLLCAVLSVPAAAQVRLDLADASLEDLMNVEITSAGRKQQRARETPAAVFVITEDDISRSGLTTLPDLLRLVPGLQVARINANNWAVSARGFNGLFSNKLLVMIDGRTIYNPLFGGVFWDVDEIAIQDIDHIEIVRGAGGATWGANAVNGVINIITKRADQTRGLAAAVRGGSAGDGDVMVRYGGQGLGANYRLFSGWRSFGHSPDTGGASPIDSAHSAMAGTRIDWRSLTLDASATAMRRGALWLDVRQTPTVAALPDRSDTRTGHVLARWTRASDQGAVTQLQSFVDGSLRNEPLGRYRRLTADVDFETRRPIRRHDLVYGGGFRYFDERFSGGLGYAVVVPDRQTDVIVNAFVQDEIALRRDGRLNLTLGSKVEHARDAGANVAPTARLMWAIAPASQHAWIAASRATRTPSAIDRSLAFTIPFGQTADGLPIAYQVRGTDAFRSETAADFETGYRLDIRNVAAIDAVAFVTSYRDLLTQEPFAPSVELIPFPHLLLGTQSANLMDAHTGGVELSARWRPASAVSMDGTYTAFSMRPNVDPSSRDENSRISNGNAPANQWRVHGSIAAARPVSLDVATSYTGELQQVAAFFRTDLRLQWRIGPATVLQAVVQNAFDGRHLEYNNLLEYVVAKPSPRAAYLQLSFSPHR